MALAKHRYEVVLLGSVPPNLVRRIAEAHAAALKSAKKRRQNKKAVE